MPTSHKVDLSVEFDNTRPYQPEDTIEGVAHAKFTDDIRVKDIQVSIHGTSYSKIEIHNRQNNTTRVYTETHVLLHDVLTVFPPPSLEEAMNSKEYTIKAGDTISNHFRFRIPMNAQCTDPAEVARTNVATSRREERFTQTKVNYTGAHTQISPLPHTFELSADTPHKVRGCVSYHLELTVHKAATFSMNSHASFPFQIQIPPPAHLVPVYTQVLTSEPITVKKKSSSEGSSKSWLSRHMVNRPGKIPITFKTVALLPDLFQVGSTFKPLVFIVTDADPSLFTETVYEGEKVSKADKEKSGISNSTGLGEIWVTKNAFKLFGRMNLRAGFREKNIMNLQPGSTLTHSKTPTSIDLAGLRPVTELGSIVLQQCCNEKYALDISSVFEDGVVPEMSPIMNICNIDYKHWLELKMTWAGQPVASMFSRTSIVLTKTTLVV